MKRLLLCALVLIVTANPARAYVDVSPTLGWLIKDAESITVLQVEKVSHEKKAILFKKVADLKGNFPDTAVRHQVAEGFHPREPKLVLDWAEPGKLAVCFSRGKGAVVCIGRYWYQCGALEDSWWAMTTGRPELGLAFYGRVETLRDALVKILAGKEIVITAVSHGAHNGLWQYNNVAFQKVLRGKASPVWRIRASLKMPDSVWQVSATDSGWVVGTGFADTENIPTLVKTLENKEAESLTRSRAASDLGLMGWKAAAALPALRRACGDADPLVRVRAARATALISEEFQVPIKVLRDSLKQQNPAIRKAAAISLGDLGADGRGAVAGLRDALQDSDVGVRWSAAEALGRIGPDAAAAVPALAAALRDPALCVIAADALGGIGAPARGAVPLLSDALKQKDADLRWTAAIALTRIDARAAKAALPLFIDKLVNGDLRARWDASMYIAPMGLEAKEAAPALRAWAKGGNGIAAATLAAIAGPEAIDVLSTLLGILDDEWDTSDSIAQIGPAAVPGVLKLLEDKKLKNHHLAIKALGLLAPKAPQCIPILIASLRSPEVSVRKAAALALGNIQPRVQKAAEPLGDALRDEDAAVRLAAAAALRSIRGAESEPAVPALIGLLTHSHADVRRDAAVGLAAYGAAAKAADAPLRAALNDADAGVRSAAACALARITGSAANHDAVAIMLEALKDKDARARQEAARFLGVVGPDARDAIAPLTQARYDENEDVRRAATEALAKIQARR
jgi:HEAT repeat protein